MLTPNMGMLKIIFITISILFILYLISSWFLLDGRIIYTTSFDALSKEESITRDLFVTDNLVIMTEGDSLKNFKDKFDVWTNKRYAVKYFGFFFNWTYTEPSWRYLEIKAREKYEDEIEWCTKDPDENYPCGCCNRIGCVVNDTVIVDFVTCQLKEKIGKLKVIIK